MCTGCGKDCIVQLQNKANLHRLRHAGVLKKKQKGKRERRNREKRREEGKEKGKKGQMHPLLILQIIFSTFQGAGDQMCFKDQLMVYI